MQCESVEDEFELFRAQSYGVESVLRHQRAASVRAGAKVKVTTPTEDDLEKRSSEVIPQPRPAAERKVKVTTPTEDDLEKRSSEVIPQPRPAAERKASFKSSARRRIYQQRIQEEEIVGDERNTTSGPSDQHGDGVAIMSGAAAGSRRAQAHRVAAIDDVAGLGVETAHPIDAVEVT